MSQLEPSPEQQPTITVLGSINMDLVIRCAKLPGPGQTVSALSMMEVPGGKGANQAVAAARCGGRVRMIGRVGDDGFGASMLSNLQAESIDCGSVVTTPHCESGIAIVSVEDSGENSIIVVPGANGRVGTDLVAQAESIIADSDTLLVQLETPIESVLAGIQTARQRGVKVVLDPAPAPTSALPAELFDVDLICPNESEAVSIVGKPLDSLQDAEAIARELFAMGPPAENGPRAVAITLGARGTMLFDGETAELIATVAVDAEDTTAAGDAFAGALAVRWSETGSLRDAIRWANLAGALAASRSGAQPSLPTRAQVQSLFSNTTES